MSNKVSKHKNNLTITQAILGIIAVGAEITTSTVIEAFSSYHNRWSKYPSARQNNPVQNSVEIGDDSAREKQRVYSVLSRLKEDGLLQSVDQRWKITDAGTARLSKLKKKEFNTLPPRKYKTEKSKNVIIVTFDIPESRRRERDWLRSVLSNSGFIMMHRSVWAGKLILPEDLLEDIRNLGIEHYIQILSLNAIVKRVS